MKRLGEEEGGGGEPLGSWEAGVRKSVRGQRLGGRMCSGREEVGRGRKMKLGR